VLGKQNANWPDIACSTVRVSRRTAGIVEIIGSTLLNPAPQAERALGELAVMLPAADCNGGVTA